MTGECTYNKKDESVVHKTTNVSLLDQNQNRMGVEATLNLESVNGDFENKQFSIAPGEKILIGRKVSAKSIPNKTNGYFDAKVLSRTHAEIKLIGPSLWITDLQSSNGTFVNNERLSDESQTSVPRELKSGDILDFGVDIKEDNGAILYRKVSCKVSLALKPKSVKADDTITAQDTEEILAMLQVSHI